MNSIREQYEIHGVEGYYKNYGSLYKNPHDEQINYSVKKAFDIWNLPKNNILDLACGSGEISFALKEIGIKCSGIDPYTSSAYHKRIGCEAEEITFDQISNGILDQRYYNLIICSYALHLVEKSKLPNLLLQLALISKLLLIITPNKNPDINDYWDLEDRFRTEKTRVRLYENRIL